MKPMIHKHHVIEFKDGKRIRTNTLVKYTIEEHAKEHKRLWKLGGHWKDELAYKGLSGLIGKEEMLREVHKHNAENRIGKKHKDKNDLENKQKNDSKFINKTIEIIEYLKPKYYFIENPLSSNIWKYIENKNYIDKYIIVDYCYFGYDYKKPTKILTNKILENKRCSCKNHKINIGATRKDMKKKYDQVKYNLLHRYSIPPKLLDYLFN